MARKEPSFGQLINYMSDIDKSQHQYNIYQNIFSRSAEDLESEFLKNAEFIQRRKNGNYMYHEILSITKAQNLDEKVQKQTLRDIAYEYAKRRASNNLVFGALHDDHDSHLHYHLIISANACGESKKTRLSKTEFDKLKKEIESQVLTHHPELEQKIVINKQAGEKLSRKGAERKRRTGKTPERDSVKQKLEDIFANCKSKEEFFSALNNAGLEFYARGNTLGVKDLATERKHRLKTLGLLATFNNLSERIKLDENTKTESKPQKSTKEENTSKQSEIEKEHTKRKSEIDTIRKKQSDANENSNKHKKWFFGFTAWLIRNQVQRILSSKYAKDWGQYKKIIAKRILNTLQANTYKKWTQQQKY